MIALLLTLLLAQAPTTTPAKEADAALQTVKAAAEFLKLPELDLLRVVGDINRTRKAMKKQPDQARGLAAESLIRITERIGSTSYERLQPYLFAATLVVGPPTQEHHRDARGALVGDDQ